MPKSSLSTADQPARSFTVRVPHDMYISMAKLAQADDVNLNQKVNQLLKLGMGEHISLDTALRRLISREVNDGGQA